jgi:hypothetical protein
MLSHLDGQQPSLQSLVRLCSLSHVLFLKSCLLEAALLTTSFASLYPRSFVWPRAVGRPCPRSSFSSTGEPTNLQLALDEAYLQVHLFPFPIVRWSTTAKDTLSTCTLFTDIGRAPVILFHYLSFLPRFATHLEDSCMAGCSIV